MSTINLTTKSDYVNAKKVVESVKNEDTNLYVYIGRPQAWPDEQTPPNVLETLDTEYNIWHDMTAMKRVSEPDIILGFRRINWVEDTVYDEYSDQDDLSTLDYYVYTDEKKIYKCISNNGGVPSTVKPTHTVANITKTVDGYRWKYMYTLSDSLARKFSVGDYLPVSEDSFIQSQATVGSIEHLKIISGGSGYPISASVDNDTEIPIYILGDGNEVSTATCNLVTVGGVVQSASVVNQGNGYPIAPETNIPVMIRQVSSTGAVETAFGTITTGLTGQVTNVDIVIGGTGYVNGSAIIVLSSCYGYAETNSSGVIINTEIATARAGENFRKAKAIVVANPITVANIRPVISPFKGHGASPERELLAKYVLINLSFAYDEGDGDFTVENNFRRIGLIENPLAYGTSTLASSRTLNAKHTLVVSNVTGQFAEDDIIYGQTSGAKGFNVDLIDGNKIRYIRDDTLSNNIDFTTETIQSASGASATITELQPPEVEPYSGDILVINNRTAIDRTSEQIETIMLVLEY